MIPCPDCDREFEKRSGLMRHVQATHPDTLEPVPVNPGGAIEPVVPVESETAAFAAVLPVLEQYAALQDLNEAATKRLVGHQEPEKSAESLDELEPGQEPYVDPPVDEKSAERLERVEGIFEKAVVQAYHMVSVPMPEAALDHLQDHAALQGMSSEQYRRIRGLIRSGRTESEAWQTVVGYEPPPRPPQPPDERPVRLQQVRNRIYTSRTGQVDQIDARWLLQLAEIGAEAVEALEWSTHIGGVSDGEVTHPEIIERWKQAIQ